MHGWTVTVWRSGWITILYRTSHSMLQLVRLIYANNLIPTMLKTSSEWLNLEGISSSSIEYPASKPLSITIFYHATSNNQIHFHSIKSSISYTTQHVVRWYHSANYSRTLPKCAHIWPIKSRPPPAAASCPLSPGPSSIEQHVSFFLKSRFRNK